MGAIGGCCCCGTCPEIAFEDLPDLEIAGMTGGLWTKVGCCWKKVFNHNTAQEIIFTDGGPLQIDNQTTVETRSLSLLKSSRPPEYFPGGIQQSDSGGPYPVRPIGPAEWRTDGTAYSYVNPYLNIERPPCPACVGPVLCLTSTETSFTESMQRWGIRSRKLGIVVYLQKVNTTCTNLSEIEGLSTTELEPTCKYLMTSSQEIQYQTVFGFFGRGTHSRNWSASSCCISPDDIFNETLYPDFNNSYLYTPVDFPSIPPRVKIVSSKLLDDLDPQGIDFGPGVCADCVIADSDVEFCDECEGDGCFQTSGTGEVPEGFCDPRIADSIVCTGGWAVGCHDYLIYTWSDGLQECFPMLGTATFCDDFSYSIYSFAGLPTCPSPRPFGGAIAFAPPGTFVLGVPAIDLSGCTTIGVGTCPVVYDPSFEPIAGYVGSIEGLTYEANCSGALDSELCIAEPWTVTIT